MDNSNLGGCLYATGISTDMNDVDSIIVKLIVPFDRLDKIKATGILKTDGSLNIEFNSVVSGNYYLSSSHPNSISIWTAYPIYIYEKVN